MSIEYYEYMDTILTEFAEWMDHEADMANGNPWNDNPTEADIEEMYDCYMNEGDKKMTFAAFVETTNPNDSTYWGGWDTKEAAAKVLQNLIASLKWRGFSIAKACVLPDNMAQAFCEHLWAV